MPPLWLIVLWVAAAVIGFITLYRPRRWWSRPMKAWAADHPDDSYTRGWQGGNALRGLIMLAFALLGTVVWLHQDHGLFAHADTLPKLPHTDSTERATARPGSAHPVEVDVSAYAKHGTGLRLVWRSWAGHLDCRLDHVRTTETTTRVTVTVYEGQDTSGQSGRCDGTGTTGWFSSRPDTTRYTDVALTTPLGGRAVVRTDGTPIDRLSGG